MILEMICLKQFQVQGTLDGWHSQLHCTRGAGTGREAREITPGVQSGVRLVVRWRHILRDGRRATSVHGRPNGAQSQCANSVQGDFALLAKVILNSFNNVLYIFRL